MSQVRGVVVIARNGDRTPYYQDPITYEGKATETTALGEVDSHNLGSVLRSIYFSPSSSSYIQGISPDLYSNQQVRVRVKAGGEGTVIFDSAIALLQGLWPPNEKNKIKLANGTVVTAPLGGYQYVPVETVEPSNDRSLESWTDCPNFQSHVKKVYNSDDFKKKEKEAQDFFRSAKDFVFGRDAGGLKNIWNLNDFVSTQLTHNQTYAYRLPPGLADQSRALANWKEGKVFGDKAGGVGNVAGRTILNTILESLERISFNDDPLLFVLTETGYQPFISLFNEFEAVKEKPELGNIPDFSSALVIELRRGAPPDVRDFLRFKFKNGSHGTFETFHVLGHRADVPLTEFIYRVENSAITSNKQWSSVCGSKSADRPNVGTLAGSFVPAITDGSYASYAMGSLLLCGLFLIATVFRRRSHEKKVRLQQKLMREAEIEAGNGGKVPYSD